MKPQIFSFIFILLCFNLYTTVDGEELPAFKFGKIGTDVLELKKCDLDTGAHAFYLFDVGFSEIKYDNTEGFKIEHNRHCAIKILTKSGYEYAEFKIPIYESTSGTMKEKVTKIKAVTYNLNGTKIEESELNKKDIFNEKENENWINFRFTLPNVKEGSVIEVEYTVLSDFLWNLPSWRFQYSIPAKWSILETRIPEYFNYFKDMKGYVSLYDFQQEKREGTIRFFNVDKSYTNSNASREYSSEQVKYEIQKEIMAARDVPAFKQEPYIDATENYISSVSFELQSTNFPSSGFKRYTSTWEEIAKTLNGDENFGKQLSAINLSKEKIDELKINDLSEVDKMKAVFDYVQKSTKWNGNNAKYTESVRQMYKTGVGNSADINILLINLLDAAGLNVSPVLLKTRDTGKLPVSHPSLSSLNYVIASVKSGEKIYLLDATEDEIAFNLLPERCLNEKGLMVKDDNSYEWIDLIGKGLSKYNTYGNLLVTEKGEINAELSIKRDGYFAYNRRQDINVEKEQVMKAFEKENIGFSVSDYKAVNADIPEEILDEQFKGTITENVNLSGDIMYFTPCLYEKYEENPFKIEERNYPVDFAYPRDYKVVYTYTIPSGWKVEEMPKSIVFKLENNGSRFIYNLQQVGDKIVYSNSFSISQSLFLPAEYKALKEFFKQIVDKQQEQIVLKKI